MSERRNLYITTFLLIGSFLIAHLCFYLLPNVFETWDAQAVDQLYQFRSSSGFFLPPYDDTIRNIDINDTTLTKMNNVYLNRTHFAHLVRNLSKMDVSAQSYDFIFAARTKDTEDKALLDAVKDAGNVYFGLAFKFEEDRNQEENLTPGNATYLSEEKWDIEVTGDPSNLYVGTSPLSTFSGLASVSDGLGYLNIVLDRDGVVRRHPLIISYQGGFYPSFCLKVICDYLGVSPGKITVKPGEFLILGDAARPGENEKHDIMIPIDRHGQMLINFVGPWGRMKHYNFADVIDASRDRDEFEIWQEELSGKIVVISEVLTGSAHVGPVPTDTHFPMSGIHTNVMNTILTESFLRESSNKEMIMIECLLLIIMFFLSFYLSPINFSAGSVLLGAFYVVMASATFIYGHLVLNFVRPIIILMIAMTSILVYRYINEEKDKMESLHQRDFVRATFGRYLSREIVDELLESPDGLKMSGEVREVTFLVSDLRGFNALSSQLPPDELIPILNHYFEHMLETITRYHGTVDELQGDGVLAFFGAPFSAEDDPERAVACAIEMQNLMPVINKIHRQQGLPEFDMGIGIHTGDVVVGNIGSEKRSKYGAVGSPINTAYRIESYTKGGQILISGESYDRVCSEVVVQGQLKVQFKGVDHDITLFDVAGMKGKYQLFLPSQPENPLTTLEKAIPIIAYLIDGKTISKRGISGNILRLGRDSAEISLKESVEAHANLKITISSHEAENLPEIYAKVLTSDQRSHISESMVQLEFTWLHKDMKTFLSEKRLGGVT